MPTETNRQVAERIAEYLFKNGAGSEADRLLLVKEDYNCSARVTQAVNLGGWSKKAVVDAIESLIREGKQ